MEGQQIGAYKIERKLGEGGMGVVWVGVDVRLGRRAAIKQLLPEMSGNHEIVERFFNEAKAAANINHPGIVEVYDVGWHADGSAYFAMKLLEGDSLASRLREGGAMKLVVAATIARQVASALSAAHARNIVHRDLKPDNIVLVPDDEMSIGERATVLDFGIAKLFGDRSLSAKTRTGMVMGTPSYMSPEQCRGAGDVDVRTDVYALGCILFEMLTGQPPFVGEGGGEVLGMHQFVEPPAVRSLRADVSPAFEAVVMRALAKRPEARHQTMGELTAELQPFATARPSMERPAIVAPPHAPTIAVRGAQVPASRPPASRPPEMSTLSASRGEVAVAAAVVAPEAAPPSIRSTMFAVIGGAVVVAAAIIGLIAATRPGREAPAGGEMAEHATPEAEAEATAGLDAAVAPAHQIYAVPIDPLDPVLGASDAGVTLSVAYTYLCPYCAMLAPELDRLRRRFPDDLRIVSKFYAIHGEPAFPSGRAACAAARQGKFADFDAAMWKAAWPSSSRIDRDQTTEVAVEHLAESAGLDMARYRNDVAGPCKQWVAAGASTLKRFGAEGTPTIWLNGRVVEVRGRAELAELVVAELARVKSSGVAPGAYYREVVMAKGATAARSGAAEQ